jgi:hypothetical protein
MLSRGPQVLKVGFRCEYKEYNFVFLVQMPYPIGIINYKTLVGLKK